MRKKVGERIKKFRSVSGLKQESVADEIGMSPGNYGKIERGEIDISASNLIRLAKTLKVTVGDFFDDKKDAKADNYLTKEEFNQKLNLLHTSLTKEITELRNEILGKGHSPKNSGKKKS